MLPGPGRWGWFAVRTEVVSLVVGLAVGVIGGLVIAWSRHHGWMSDTWAQLARWRDAGWRVIVCPS